MGQPGAKLQMGVHEPHFVPRTNIISFFLKLPLRGVPFQKMIQLRAIRFTWFQIKINPQSKRKNSTGGKGDLWRHRRRDRKKFLTKAERENYLPSCLCIRKSLPGSTGSSTKRKGSENQLQEVRFCNFGSTKSGPSGREGGREERQPS